MLHNIIFRIFALARVQGVLYIYNKLKPNRI